MQKAYSRINWENYPSTETPLNESNLNKIDEALNTVDNRVVEFDTTKANQVDLLTCVNGITLNTSTGILTISFKNGTSTQIDTGLAKLAVNFDYDEDPTSPHYQQLILEMKDGTYKYIDLSAMITQFEFDNTSTVAFTVNAQTGHISAIVPDGSITAEKLNPNVVVTMQAIEDAAEADALKSEGHAVGEQNGVPVGPGSPYYHNNAKYYCEEAQGGGSGGHVIKDGTNTFIQRTGLKFMGKVSVTDDAVGGNTVVTVEAGGAVPHLIVLSEAGSTVRAVKGSTTIYATETSAEHFECDLEMDDPQDIYGVWTIHAVLDGDDAMMSLNVDTIKVYVVDDSHMHADITVTYPNGATVSCSMSGAPTQYATESPYTFVVHSYGVWRITGTRGGVTETHDVTIYENGQEEEVTLSLIPDGSTVTPTDDIQLWLACAGIEDKPYTMLQQVLADSATLLKVLTNDNASDYLARSTTWATGITADSNAMAIIGSYDYVANTLLADSTWNTAIQNSTYFESVDNVKNPVMTSATTPKGKVTASSYNSANEPYKAFASSGAWLPQMDATNNWVAYDFEKQISLKRVNATFGVYQITATEFTIQGSNDGTTWNNIGTITSKSATSSAEQSTITTSNNYSKFRIFTPLVIFSNSGSRAGNINVRLTFYGRENGGVQSWLKAGGIQKSYTQLSQILGDTATLRDLMASNDAVDYLVTAKAFIDDICANQTAMSLIGANDYAADTLLADSEWAEAIAKSTYADNVLNVKVPTMTSNTTPEGECIGSTPYNTQIYQAFDGNTSSFYQSNAVGTFNWLYIGYVFPTAQAVKVAKGIVGVSQSPAYNLTNKIQYSDDGTNWSDASGEFQSNYNSYFVKAITELTKHRYWRVYCVSGSSTNGRFTSSFLQFYGREDGGVQTWLHSAGITNKFYTTLSEVLADTTTLSTLMASHDAVDYLVTAKAFIDDIVASETAMNYIGANDYASEKLLTDSNWLNAIFNSTYFESVFNTKVPTMTSNTTPIGEAKESSEYNSNYPAYRAFDGDDTASIYALTKNEANAWIEYVFTHPVKIKAFRYKGDSNNTGRSPNGYIQASTDGINYTNLKSINYRSISEAKDILINDNLYDRYRIYNSDTAILTAFTIQFYGRENGGVQDWLRAGGIDESYSTLAEVLADSITLSALISSQDAVDYLVTAKGLIDGIVADSTAMSYIGLNNYCANTLLADADWLDAICNSTYMESVLNVKVPTMTSNTTPSGEAFGSSLDIAGSVDYWKAFNGSRTGYWASNRNQSAPQYLGYNFEKPVIIKAIVSSTYVQSDFVDMNTIIQGSNDGTTWTDIKQVVIPASMSTTIQAIENNNNEYEQYRFYCLNENYTSYNGSCQFYIANFYGREDV